MKLFFLSCFTLFYVATNAQQISIKGGMIGLRFFEGFPGSILSGGVELINKKASSSWQLSYNNGEGAAAQDATQHVREWLTLDKMFYVKINKRVQFLYSPFIEVGNRIEYPGYGISKPDSIFKNKNSFEINPGISVGASIPFTKHFGIQLLAGPKLIVANAKSTWYNSTTKNYFYATEKEVKVGYRFNAYLYYKFTF